MRNLNKIKVCFFGTYDKKYSSNKIILDGLFSNDVKIFELGIDTRVTKLNSSEDLSFLSLFKRVFAKLRLIPKTIKNYKKVKECDIIFVGYPGHFDLILAIILAKILHKKLVFYPLIILYITFTEDIQLFDKSSIYAKILKTFEKILYSFPDIIVADIPYQKQIFKEIFNVPVRKIRELPIGADEKIYRYSAKKKNNLFTVVYYGLYSPIHGVEHIIHAAHLLKEHKDIRFLLVGNGQRYQENYELAKKLKTDNVEFFSNVTENNALKLLQSADVFTGFLQDSPAAYRVLPNKVYQGLALGRTVLTGDSPAARIVFEHKKNAYLCKLGDAADIAKSILELKNNPALNASIAKNGFSMFSLNFSKQAVGLKLKEIFLDVINKEISSELPSISIGIPTYEAGMSLVNTLNSIYRQTSYKYIKTITVIIDGNTINKNILNKIKNKKLEIIYKYERRGQATRINDIFNNANTDYLLMLNDDVILEKHAMRNILNKIVRTKADLYACAVEPLKPSNSYQRILNIGFRINQEIASSWNHGDNYLSVNGRGIVLSSRLFKTMHIPPQIWNNDAYIYIYASLRKYIFDIIPNAFVYYQLPATHNDHEKQSSKFAHSYNENSLYFKEDIKKYYRKPILLSGTIFVKHLLKKPIQSVAYILFLIYYRYKKIKFDSLFTDTYWETDPSTKVT